ncbi:Protein kinase domain [Trypanosoma vivax]|nr:putative protein kinase [Trypanosoma vivax]KAH8611755.1 Protein kinase domain [Trypanosoma vivax]
MNRYTVLGQLGDGSFGVVSKAQQTNTGEIVAVKKMKQRFNSWEECLQLREVQLLRKVQHPNIVKLKEVVRENNELFLVFEYMEMNLFSIQRMRAEQMSGVQSLFNDREIRSIMCQTLLAVQAMHKSGFMHRDLKPENLLIKGDIVKVADFGLAKEIRSRPPFTEYVSTRWYRAPEIILRSTHYNSPVDIWACGVLFAELYLNRPLFPGSSDNDQLFKICSVLGAPTPAEWDEGHQLSRRLNMRFPTVAPTPLRQLLSSAPPTAIDLIEQMLRFNPSDRPTATQCLQHQHFTGTGNTAETGGTATALYAGISTGQPHNPFQFQKKSPSSPQVGAQDRCQSPGVGVASAGVCENSSSFECSTTKPPCLNANAGKSASFLDVVRSVPHGSAKPVDGDEFNF